VKVAWHRGDVFTAAGGGEQPSCRVLNIQFIEGFVGRAVEEAVAVVKSGGYEGRDGNVSGGKGQGGPEAYTVSSLVLSETTRK